MLDYLRGALFIVVILAGTGCQNRTEKDVTNSEEQSISPNQVISKEEQMKKDSTEGDIIGRDTTVNKNRNQH